MTRHFIRKSQTLSIIALFVAGIGALTLFATAAIAQNPVPFLDQPLVPDATVPGGPGFTLTLNGAGFVAGSVVNWNGSPRATTFVRNSQLTAAVLASDIATASTASVTVVNPSPGGGASNTVYFPIAVAEGAVSFLPAVTYAPGGQYPNSVAVGDLNGDGKPDLAVTNWSCFACGNNQYPTVGVLLGNGDGTFQPTVSYDASGPEYAYADSVAIADVNGDGIPDLVVTSAVGPGQGQYGAVGVLLGNGDGTFQAAVIYSSGGYSAGSVVVADLNGDGKLDLVVANGCGGSSSCSAAVSILLGNGDGTFQPAVPYGSSVGGASSVAVADVNGDGKLDLLVAYSYNCNCETGTTGVLLGNGDGTFQPGASYDGAGGGSVVVADVNGDGKPDLLVTTACAGSCGNGTVGVLLGNGDGTFQPEVTYGMGGYQAASVAVGDINGDGKIDLLVANGCLLVPDVSCDNNTIGVLLGNGDGTFQSATTYGSGGFDAVSIAASDVNGDGRLDVVVVNICDNAACNNQAGPVGVLTNDSGPHIPTTTTLASSLNPSVVGQPITFTAVVGSASGKPKGTVVFSDGSTVLGSAELASGSASISTSSLAVGLHSITAAYQVSYTFSASTSAPLSQTVNPATTTISLASPANPAPVDSWITYCATVITNQNCCALTGTVAFHDGGTTIGTTTLISPTACSNSQRYAEAGIHELTATYSGDANNVGSTSPVLTEYIQTQSEATLSTSGSPSFVGQPVTFTATVASRHGTIPNGEPVTFYDGATAIGAGTTASGVARFTTSSLTAKTHAIKAIYAGDGAFGASTGSLKQVVDKYPTTTTLSSTPNPSNYGQAVTLTARVTSAGPAPTGSVTFKNGSASVGVVALNGGVATFTTAKIPVGANTLTSTYNEDAFDGKSVSAAMTQTVNRTSVSMTLTSTPNPSTFGKSVKFTARLTSNGGLPTGQPVTFSYNGAILGTANVTSTGVATFSTETLPAGGSDVVTAAYAGSVDYSSASASVTQVVN